MKKSIRLVLLGEIILLAAVFLMNIIMGNWGVSAVAFFIDLPSILLILLVLIPGLIIMGEWKDFIKSFSVGLKPYSLLELKNIVGAVGAAQKLTIYSALMAIIISAVLMLGRLDDLEMIGANLAICFLAGLYAVIIEFFRSAFSLRGRRKNSIITA